MANYPTTRPLLSTQLSPSPPQTPTPPPKLPNSDIVVILTGVLCILICAVFIMGLIRWTCQKQALTSASTTTDAELSNQCLNNKARIVEGLPRMTFKSSSSVAVSAECVICLSEFLEGDVIRMLPACSHVFHVDCIDAWLVTSQSFCCPSCRQVLVVGSSQPSRNVVEPDFLP